ncbi:DedA family protein [Halopseudomonas xinjiangensis]|uniref:DedA family protein n=1 Tax=Halopseudomonas xinjiangensis TaxID=487184 RepID=UPI001E37706D|nr:hypothetical protein [Halopseudomonas xinjiangensis]
MVEIIVDIVASTGYIGVFLLMFVENSFPPLPSELITPPADFSAAKGEWNFFGVVAAGTAGLIVGALP